MTDLTREQIEAYFDHVSNEAFLKFGYGITNQIRDMALGYLDKADWKSPAEVQEIALAAQAEAFEQAVKLASDYKTVSHGNLSLDPQTVLDETADEIASAIRFLTPSPGQWRQVPEGDKHHASKIVEELEAQMKHSLNAYSLPLWPEEAALIVRTFRAMIGASEVKP